MLNPTAGVLQNHRGLRRLLGTELSSSGVTKGEGAPGCGHEETPTGRADKEGNGIARAIGVGLPTGTHVFHTNTGSSREVYRRSIYSPDVMLSWRLFHENAWPRSMF